MESNNIVAGNRFVYHCGMHTEISTYPRTEMVPEAVTAEMGKGARERCRDQGDVEERGDLRCTMRRWSSALTPVLLSPFTWQMDESCLLNRELPWTCLSSAFTSCREIDVMLGDAMVA